MPQLLLTHFSLPLCLSVFISPCLSHPSFSLHHSLSLYLSNKSDTESFNGWLNATSFVFPSEVYLSSFFPRAVS